MLFFARGPEMIIANPIYDVVFKRLMEDQRVAKFFVETLTGETIEEIELRPQEFTYYRELELAAKGDSGLEAFRERMYGLLGLAVYRVDFIATIRTAEGEFKKVLIEIQKAKNSVDLMRFRNYLGEQYKKEDEIHSGTGVRKSALPIITIYLLGFSLPEIESSVIKVSRQYTDLITNTVIDKKSDFIEKLTHDCFVVQIPRIQPRLQSKLETLLTIFEQGNFIDETELTKNYPFSVSDETMQNIVNILHHAGTDPDGRKDLEKEQEALRVFEAGMSELRQRLSDKEKELSEKEKELTEKENKLSERERELSEKDRIIEELKRRLAE